jgi:hypothetical protein
MNKFWSLGFPLKHCTAEAPFDVAQDRLRTRSKEFLINKFSDLCELCASAGESFFTENPDSPKI